MTFFKFTQPVSRMLGKYLMAIGIILSTKLFDPYILKTYYRCSCN